MVSESENSTMRKKYYTVYGIRYSYKELTSLQLYRRRKLSEILLARAEQWRGAGTITMKLSLCFWEDTDTRAQGHTFAFAQQRGKKQLEGLTLILIPSLSLSAHQKRRIFLLRSDVAESSEN